MSSCKPTATKKPDQVMKDATQGTGQSSTPLNTSSEVSTMINAMSNPVLTTGKTKETHRLLTTTNGSGGTISDATQSTDQTSTTPKTNLQVSPMTGTTKKKTISPSEQATTGRANGLGNPIAQFAATVLGGISAPKYLVYDQRQHPEVQHYHSSFHSHCGRFHSALHVHPLPGLNYYKQASWLYLQTPGTHP
jgi:hypothetical protein